MSWFAVSARLKSEPASLDRSFHRDSSGGSMFASDSSARKTPNV